MPQHGNQASANFLPMEETQMEGLPQPLQEHVFNALTNNGPNVVTFHNKVRM